MNPAFKAMYNLLQSDRRYKFEAYNFVRESLNQAQQLKMAEVAAAAGDDSNTDDEVVTRHITGQQLCEACRLHAIEQYGYMASKVLGSWGIQETGDFGEIVYNLIRIDQMKKSDADRREDFDDVYAFDTAFEPQFKLPTPSS